jgi:iron complex transport system ATP-binding protein
MLTLTQVSGGYGAAIKVKDVSLSFERGVITGIMGRNGCGKSSLLKLACGVIEPRSGEVTLGGRRLRRFDRAERAREIAYLPQSRNAPDMTVGRLTLHGRFPYLGYPRVYRRDDYIAADRAMERAGVLPLKNALLGEISGGERQKAYMAMLIAQDSGVVLLDEPTTYLDIICQIETAEIIKEFRNMNKAVALVTHDMNMAYRLCDALVLMNDGEIMYHGETSIAMAKAETVFGLK